MRESMAVKPPWERIIDCCMELSNYVLGYQRLLFPYFVLHDHVHASNVARYARSLSALVGATTQAHMAILECSAYLHDCGMALPPRVINRLELTEGEVREDSEEALKKLEDVLGSKYREYFQEGVLRLRSELAPLGYLDALVVRALHAWLSARFIERNLYEWLRELKVEDELLHQVTESVAAVVRWHNSNVKLVDNTREVGGYRVNLGDLARVLRLADAMDFSRARGRFVYEQLVEDLRENSPSMLKHWVFKMAVRDVRLDFDSGGLLVEAEGEGRVESRAALLGVLLFEVAHNLLTDYGSLAEKTSLGIAVRFNGIERDLGGRLEKLRECYARLSGIKLRDLKGLSAARDLIEELEERLREEVSRGLTAESRALTDKLVDRFDFFDAIAFALCEESRGALQSLLDRASKECPYVGILWSDFGC